MKNNSVLISTCFLCKYVLKPCVCYIQGQVLELSWADGDKPLFLSWIRGGNTSSSSSSGQEDRVELSRQFGEKLGLCEGTQVT